MNLIYRITKKMTVDFSGLAGSSAFDEVVATGIDVTQWRFATAAIRVFAVTIPSGGEIKVSAVPQGDTPEDPTLDGTWMSTPCGVLTLDNTASAPTFHLVDLTAAPMGGVIAFIVRGKQPATPATLKITLSIELVLKN